LATTPAVETLTSVASLSAGPGVTVSTAPALMATPAPL